MTDQGQPTGTRDETHDVVAVLYHALQGAENTQTYARDAKDERLRQFFEHASQQQRRLADEAKRMLQQTLGRENRWGDGASTPDDEVGSTSGTTGAGYGGSGGAAET